MEAIYFWPQCFGYEMSLSEFLWTYRPFPLTNEAPPFNPHQLQRVTAGLPEPNQTENELSALFTEQENHENLQGMPSMAQLKEAIFGVDLVEVDVVRGDPQVDLEKVIEHDLLDSPSRDNSFAPSRIPNEEEARLSLEISESRSPMEVEDQASH